MHVLFETKDKVFHIQNNYQNDKHQDEPQDDEHQAEQQDDEHQAQSQDDEPQDDEHQAQSQDDESQVGHQSGHQNKVIIDVDFKNRPFISGSSDLLGPNKNKIPNQEPTVESSERTLRERSHNSNSTLKYVINKPSYEKSLISNSKQAEHEEMCYLLSIPPNYIIK